MSRESANPPAASAIRLGRFVHPSAPTAPLLLLLGIAAWALPAAVSTCAAVPPTAWRSLFDGKSLAGWKKAEFGGDGEIEVKDGRIIMGPGATLTGVTLDRDDFKPRRSNYEIRLEAMRVDGIDFFCGLTFPVKDSHCSFIVGGWAGAVVGLSSIDGKDASENKTTKFVNFKTGRWYAIRVRVTDENISCWIDGKQMVDQDLAGKKITTRAEVDLSQPIGITAWQTKAALRGIEIKSLQVPRR